MNDENRPPHVLSSLNFDELISDYVLVMTAQGCQRQCCGEAKYRSRREFPKVGDHAESRSSRSRLGPGGRVAIPCYKPDNGPVTARFGRRVASEFKMSMTYDEP
jgi:hypothetical protein